MADQRVRYVIEAQNLLSKVLQQIEGQANKTDAAVEGIGKKSGGRGLMGSIVGGNLISSGIQRATGALVDFGKESISAFAKFEQFGVALTTMFHGNKAESRWLSNQLVDFAKTTPFELTEIQDATKQLIAYGSTSGSVTDELKLLGNISSGVGAPLGEIAYLYGTARTQGRLFSRDIYQLSGRGIPIVEALAKQFHVTKSKVMELVEQGKVGFPEMKKALESLTAEGGQFFNMMSEQSKTLGGRWSNLQDALGQLQVKLAESKSGLMSQLVDWSTTFVNNLVSAQDIVNHLQENRRISKTDNQNWNQRNFHFFGRNTTANMENMQSYADITQELAIKNLNEGNIAMFNKYTDEISNQLLENEKFLGVGRFKGMMHASRGGGLDKRGFNEEEVRAEMAMWATVSRNLSDAANLKSKQGRDAKLAANDVTGGKPDKTKLGTGTTIESGAPKNMYININKLIETLKIESVDGDIPTAKMKAEVSKVLLEVVSDADKAIR